jgi:heterodisulfide reductase subunit B
MEIKLRNHDLFSDLDLGVKFLQKSKLPFFPEVTRPARKASPIAGASEALAYYPGCSLHSTAKEYDRSSRAVCELLEMKLVEPHGWVCCGSSAAHRADPEKSLRLPMQNLALIEQSGFKEVTMPCAACFQRHKAALHEIRQDESQHRRANEMLDYEYQDTVRVSNLSQAIHQHVGVQKVAEKVRKPLKGLRVVCYYGCLLTRPPEVTEAEHPENPTDLDEIMQALGAEVLDWSYKTTCCGAAHSLTRPDIVLKLSSNLIQHARQAGADLMAVACPLCHTNLDARQFQMNLEEPMPVFYFTQLMALALGASEKTAGLHKNLIDPLPLLREKGILPAT